MSDEVWVWPAPEPRTPDAAVCPVCGYKHHGAMCPATYGTKIAELEAQIAQLKERLEIGFAFDGDGNRIPVGDDMPDGIECRDETIRLQDEENARLRRKVRKLKAKLGKSRRLAKLWFDTAMRGGDDGWLDISSAPKDGSLILLWWKRSESPEIGRWKTNERLDPFRSNGEPKADFPDWARALPASYFSSSDEWDDYDAALPENAPTHWMPLPKPPTVEEASDHGLVVTERWVFSDVGKDEVFLEPTKPARNVREWLRLPPIGRTVDE